VDRWDGQTYRRALLLADGPVEVAVMQTGPPDAPRLQVTATGMRLAPGAEATVTAALERLLGLRIDLAAFYQLAARDEQLGPLALRFRGLKPPRFPTLFESLVNAIACQQVTLTLGIHLLNRLTETYGIPVAGQATPAYVFPRPEDLFGIDPEAIRALGWSRQRARALSELARTHVEGRLDLDRLARASTAPSRAGVPTPGWSIFICCCTGSPGKGASRESNSKINSTLCLL
jgi:DNA-3-methyladenine glycosylase II